MQRKMNPILLFGLLANTFSIIANRFFLLPNFVACFITGTCAGLLLLGCILTFLPQKRLQAMRSWKQNIFKQ